jgi:hypothetical protein
VRFWGLASRQVDEVIEFYRSRAEAEQALAQVLRDEPDWCKTVYLVSVELPDAAAPAPFSLS